ncbi:hypothetical protein [Pseudomonas reidholzensis]|uniref:hypothetical protein n=1 Tax=Pseudomonas reidholzensis TaxID=1785162 RepID=UPI001FC975A0|nr:hypothetical protein [Pseudomonas reidholzensis]
MEFAAYPVASRPAYRRWLATGAALVALSVLAGVALRSYLEPPLAIAGFAGALLAWLGALLLRVLYYRCNRHNAQRYAQGADQQRQAWWRHHRRNVALVDSVLISAACSKPDQIRRLLTLDEKPTPVQEPDGGAAIRVAAVFGHDVLERERNLAVLLALHWQAQRSGPDGLEFLVCYWQGSSAAWHAFAQQMAQTCPEVCLPESPEPWQGIQSLDRIIDQLHQAPAGARVLCAGCHSSPIDAESPHPAGEAAVLWLLGTDGGVSVSRGEWFMAGTEPLESIAERALQQSEMQAPAKVCMSFAQPPAAGVSALGWSVLGHTQDPHFGALAQLEAMVVLTLAAWYAEQFDEPCAWLATDPHYTLILGVVKPNDWNN